MPKKNILNQYELITAGAMTGTTVITFPVTCVQWMDNIGIQFNFTGSPVGNFQVQVSADYRDNQPGSQVINSGHWVPVLLTYQSDAGIVQDVNIPTTVGSPIYLDLNQLSAPYVRFQYTNVSGTGSLDAFITGKSIG